MKKAGQLFIKDVHSDARQHYDQFISLGKPECFEQVEAHLESEGYSRFEIDSATERLFGYGF